MNTNDLINKAFNNGFQMLGGKDLHVLEGNPAKNELRVLPLEELYKNNLMGFAFGLANGFLVLGIFNSKEAAEESMVVIRTMIRDAKGDRI